MFTGFSNINVVFSGAKIRRPLVWTTYEQS